MLTPDTWQFVTRFLIGWNIALWFYLILISWLMFTADHEKVKKVAKQQDKSALVVFALMVTCAISSFIAILVELSSTKDLSNISKAFHFIITGSTVLGSWLLLGVVFTFHYAHLFYFSKDIQLLKFPDDEKNPNYWDFLYFSFTIATAVQTSDICVNSRTMRKIVLLQSILSFFFNAAILGLSINVAAGLVSNQ